MENRYIELFLSFLTLVLVVVAIIIFIYTGGSFIFYLVSAIAIIMGLLNIWKISGSLQEHIKKESGLAVQTVRKTARKKAHKPAIAIIPIIPKKKTFKSKRRVVKK